jgi:hypothetical protein
MTAAEVDTEKANLHDEKITPLVIVKYIGSIGILIFSIILVGALMFTGNTRVSNETNPWVCLIVCILAITWLTMIEGQQASLVGLPPVDPVLYKDSHPVTYKNGALAFKGDNLDRYLMGRQFMVLMVVFVVNQCGQPLNPKVDVLGMPDGVKFVFLDIGLGMIVFTCVLGQLWSQVIATHSMIDYINNYFALFTLYTAMCVEFSGIMHSAYLIQYAMAAISGKPIITNEEPKTGFNFAFFWARVLMSLAILSFCMAVVLVALFNGDTMVSVKYPTITPPLAVFMFFFFMGIVGCLEGMQVAFFCVAKLPMEQRGTNWFGKKTSQILFAGNGRNFPGFMIGRQLTVVASFFTVGAITGLNITPGEGNNIFGISDSSQKFLNFGFHGAVITTIVASITWQYAASAFPIAAINNPITYVLLLFALCLEGTGICSAAWVIGGVYKKAMGIQYDEVYVGTPEERMANNHPDKELNVEQDVGHLTGGGFTRHLCGSHDALDGPIRSKDAIDARV